MTAPLIIVTIVFIGIAVRKFGSISFAIWQVMTIGALLMLLTGSISPLNAFHAINWDVILFLFCMFVIGEALHSSGYLFDISYMILKPVKNGNTFLFMFIVITGFLSAILMNDTIAIIGTHFALYIAGKYHLPIKPLLLTLAFSVTTGSVCSPLGNPQNFIIANAFENSNPFSLFAMYLLLPTILLLIVVYITIKIHFKKDFSTHRPLILQSRANSKDNQRLKALTQSSLAVLVFGILLMIGTSILGFSLSISPGLIALIACVPIILFDKNRGILLKKVDWLTLVFFGSMFIVMRAVWDCGFFQSLIVSQNLHMDSISVVITLSVTISQIISNVPFVELYVPLLKSLNAPTIIYMALAAASTLAGNALILGAASNVIIIQQAEKHHATLTFKEFARIGIPLTIAQLIILQTYFTIIS